MLVVRVGWERGGLDGRMVVGRVACENRNRFASNLVCGTQFNSGF